MEIRCSNCEKLLAKLKPNKTVILKEIVPHMENVKGIDDDHSLIEIKCPRCKQMNELTV